MKRTVTAGLGRDIYADNPLQQIVELTRRVRALEAAAGGAGDDMATAQNELPTAAPALYVVNEDTGEWYRLVCHDNSAGQAQLYLRPIRVRE